MVEPLVLLDAEKGRDPGREDLDTALRAVRAALAWAVLAARPGCVDAAYEVEAGVLAARQGYGQFAGADLVAPAQPLQSSSFRASSTSMTGMPLWMG